MYNWSHHKKKRGGRKEHIEEVEYSKKKEGYQEREETTITRSRTAKERKYYKDAKESSKIDDCYNTRSQGEFLVRRSSKKNER